MVELALARRRRDDRPRLRVLRARGAGGHRERARPAARARGGAALRRPRARDGADRATPSTPAAWATSTRPGPSTGARGTRRARGWPTTRSIAPPPGSTRWRRSRPTPREFDGLRFTEVVSVTRVAGGIADNVVPAEAVAHVNYRYAPGPQRRRGRGVAARRCASRTARWPSRATPPARPVAIANPMAQRLIAVGRPGGRAQAGVDAGRRVRRRRRRRHQLRPGRPRPGPRPRGARARRRARALLRDDRGLRVRLNPVLAGMTSYPVPAPDRGQARRRRARRRRHRLRRRRAARGDAGLHPAGARARRSRPSRCRPTRSADGLPELREAIAGWARRRFGAALDPDTEIIPTQGSKEAIFHLAQVVRRARRPRRRDHARLPGGGARRALRRRASSSSSRSIPRAAGSPTSTPSTGTAWRCCG